MSGSGILGLLRKDIEEGYRTFLAPIGAVTGVLFVVYCLRDLSGFRDDAGTVSAATATVHMTPFVLLLFGGGLFLSSRSFVEIHTKARNAEWFMLPTQLFEKFLVRVLLATVGWAVGTIAYYFLFSLLASLLAKVIVGEFMVLFDPLTGKVWLAAADYVVVQSLFVFGAIFFKRNHFMKSVLAVSGAFLLLWILATVVEAIAFGQSAGTVTIGGWNTFIAVRGKMESAAHTLFIVVQVVYWALLGPVMWTAGYRRLARTEVIDGA